MIVSMAATTAIEDIAAAAREVAPDPGLWFQLYLQPDLEFTEAIVRRAEAAGVKAFVVTVDSPVLGRRERDDRNGFHDLPPGLAVREPAQHRREPQRRQCQPRPRDRHVGRAELGPHRLAAGQDRSCRC